MIGLARRAAPKEPTPQLAAQTPDDGPPAAFVERVHDEAGDVILAPFLDALRVALAKHRRADGSKSDPEALTPGHAKEAP